MDQGFASQPQCYLNKTKEKKKNILSRKLISTVDGTSNPRSQFKNNTSQKQRSHRNPKSTLMRAKRGLVILCYLKGPLSLWPSKKGSLREKKPHPAFSWGFLWLFSQLAFEGLQTNSSFSVDPTLGPTGRPNEWEDKLGFVRLRLGSCSSPSCSRPLPSTAHAPRPHARWAA